MFFITVFSVGVFAQDRFAIGIKAGYTSTKFNVNNLEQRLLSTTGDAKSGYLAGIFTRVRIYKGLSIQPEVFYTKKAGRNNYNSVNIDFPDVDTSFTTTMTSLDLPLLLHLRLLSFDLFNIYAIGGPVISFNLDGSSDPEYDEFSFEKSNWTMQFGGGIEIWRFTADVRYEWPVGDVGSGGIYSGHALAAPFDYNYNMLTFSVGFKIFGI